jgi:hypothetical protein
MKCYICHSLVELIVMNRTIFEENKNPSNICLTAICYEIQGSPKLSRSSTENSEYKRKTLHWF